MPRWFEIRNAAAEDVATVAILDEIGLWGITAADFNRDFRAIKANVINLEINSPGGSVFDGLAIYNMLRGSGKTINAKVMGVAASIASIILMAADKISMPANSMVMVHSPMGGVFGTADEMRDFADMLDKVKVGLVATYMKRTGKSEAEVMDMLAKDTWMTAAEAKENGFADEVIDAVEMSAKFDLERIPEAARAVFAKAKPAAKTADEIAAEEAAAQAAADAAAAAQAAAAKASVPFADQVKALATEAGFEVHASAWALAYTKPEEVTARIGAAREIKAFCALAGKADQADGFVKAGKSVADVRTELQNAQAAADKHVDTAKKGDGPVANAPNVLAVYDKRAAKDSNQPIEGPSAATTAGIWAKRNKQTAGA